MKDYSKTQIYALYSPNTTKVYFGHTIQHLVRRLSKHRSDSKVSTVSNASSAKIIIDAGDPYIKCMEVYPCRNVDEATAREQLWINNSECVNTSKAYRLNVLTQTGMPYKFTREYRRQYMKKYYDLNTAMDYMNRIHLSFFD